MCRSQPKRNKIANCYELYQKNMVLLCKTCKPPLVISRWFSSALCWVTLVVVVGSRRYSSHLPPSDWRSGGVDRRSGTFEPVTGPMHHTKRPASARYRTLVHWRQSIIGFPWHQRPAQINVLFQSNCSSIWMMHRYANGPSATPPVQRWTYRIDRHFDYLLHDGLIIMAV